MRSPAYQSGFSFLKLLLPIVFVALGIGAFKYMVESKPVHEVPVPREKTWSVQVGSLRAEMLAPEIEIQGRVEAPDLFRAAAPGVGWVEAVNVREGDRVRAGDVLVKLDSRDFTTALTQAEAELADIEAQLVEMDIRYAQDQSALEDEQRILNLTRNSVKRSTALKKQSLSSDSELEEAERALMRQQLLVNQRELAVRSYESRKQQLLARKKRVQAQLEQAHRALERSLAVAPYDGVVASVELAVGGRVNAGAEMVTMYSPGSLEVRALVPARFQGELKQALQNGEVLTAKSVNSGSEYQGASYELVRLAGEARPGGVDGFFRPLDNQISGISPGGLVTILLQRPARQNLYRVPPSSVYENSRIYLLREGRLAGIDVEIVGSVAMDGESFRLVSSEGISDGDELVLTRLPNASTGLKVKPIGKEAKPGGKDGKPGGMNGKAGAKEGEPGGKNGKPDAQKPGTG